MIALLLLATYACAGLAWAFHYQHHVLPRHDEAYRKKRVMLYLRQWKAGASQEALDRIFPYKHEKSLAFYEAFGQEFFKIVDPKPEPMPAFYWRTCTHFGVKPYDPQELAKILAAGTAAT